MAFSPKTRGRCWVGTIHISNMEKAGLTKEEYENPEYLSDFFISLWENSGKNRQAGIAVCVSKEGCYHCHIACYGNTTTLKKVSYVLFQSHIEPQLGGKDSLKNYLLKEGEFAEKGEQVLYTQGLDSIIDKQGQRNDLEEIEELINDGYTPEQIFEECFRYRKYERMIKSAYLQKRINETPLVKICGTSIILENQVQGKHIHIYGSARNIHLMRFICVMIIQIQVLLAVVLISMRTILPK